MPTRHAKRPPGEFVELPARRSEEPMRPVSSWPQEVLQFKQAWSCLQASRSAKSWWRPTGQQAEFGASGA